MPDPSELPDAGDPTGDAPDDAAAEEEDPLENELGALDAMLGGPAADDAPEDAPPPA